MTPLEEHIAHGLYGVYIVDPKTPRPPADEMVMVISSHVHAKNAAELIKNLQYNITQTSPPIIIPIIRHYSNI